jgi:hypothetical protein
VILLLSVARIYRKYVNETIGFEHARLKLYELFGILVKSTAHLSDLLKQIHTEQQCLIKILSEADDGGEKHQVGRLL